MTFYLIRHKESGKFMPLMRRGKGYSHWNPSNVNAHKVVAATNIPRLLENEKQAKKVIAQWFACPNGKHTSYQSYYGEWDEMLDITADNRKKEDLEIVKVNVTVES